MDLNARDFRRNSLVHLCVIKQDLSALRAVLGAGFKNLKSLISKNARGETSVDIARHIQQLDKKGDNKKDDRRQWIADQIVTLLEEKSRESISTESNELFIVDDFYQRIIV